MAARPRFGLRRVNLAAHVETLDALVETAAAHGVESLWASDHLVDPPVISSRYPYRPDGRRPTSDGSTVVDPFVWLAHAGRLAPSLGLATGMLLLPLREVVATAHQYASLAALYPGRVIAGVGIGWLREEFAALGVDWSGRATRSTEAVNTLRALWAGEACLLGSRLVEPRPPEPIPVVIGGHSAAAARRASNEADGFFPHPPDQAARLVEIARSARRVLGAQTGIRTAADLEITVGLPDSSAVGRELRGIGVDRVVAAVSGTTPEEVAASIVASVELFHELFG